MSLVTRAQREIAFPRDVLSSLPRSGSVRVLKHAREILIAILSCISYVFSLADLPPSLSLSLSLSLHLPVYLPNEFLRTRGLKIADEECVFQERSRVLLPPETRNVEMCT
jgi:hypothetical protein